MSKIKDLKSNEENVLNIVDVIELFSPEKKSKYTELLLKCMKSTPNFKEHTKEIRAVLSKEFDETIEAKEWDKFTDLQIMWVYKFIDTFFNFADLKKFTKFCEYNERGVIELKDVTAYKDFDAVIHQLEIAETKVIEKETIYVNIHKGVDDNEMILIKDKGNVAGPGENGMGDVKVFVTIINNTEFKSLTDIKEKYEPVIKEINYKNILPHNVSKFSCVSLVNT